MDTILISEAIITWVMILFITIAGTHLLYSVLTSGTYGATTIMDGMAIAVTIVMATMITDRVIMQITIIMVIIQTGLCPPVTRRGETVGTILKHQLIIIMDQEGKAQRPVMQGMKSTTADR